MKNFASIASLAFAVLVTDYLIVKTDGSRLDRYPLKKKNPPQKEA